MDRRPRRLAILEREVERDRDRLPNRALPLDPFVDRDPFEVWDRLEEWDPWYIFY